MCMQNIRIFVDKNENVCYALSERVIIMRRKTLSFLLLAITAVCFLLPACGKQEKPFPPSSAFSSRAEVVSVTRDGTDYVVKVNTILKNNSETDYQIYGNPSCWNVLYVNGHTGTVNLVGGSYMLKSGAELTEEKTVTLSAREYANAQMHVESSFAIEHKDGETQKYTIISDTYTLSEEETNV